MKKLFVLVCLACMLCTCIPNACAEEVYQIEYATYERDCLKGHAIVPEGEKVYVRVTMYLEGNYYIRLYTGVQEDGSFEIDVFALCKYATVALVNQKSTECKPLAVYEIKEFGR